MDAMQVGLGVVLLGTAPLLVFGRTQAESGPVLYGMAALAVALTIGAVAICAIRDRESRAF